MRFAQQLCADVSGPPLVLPSYPEAALRVQRVLSDINASNEAVVKAFAMEPVLAARVLTMANSAALNRSGAPVTDLSAAITALGFDTLRTAAVTFAMSQLRQAVTYRQFEKPMYELWQRSVKIAAISFVLTRALKRFSPDTVMLAGLVSGVGRLYILTRSGQFPELFANPDEYEAIVHKWHAQVARSILENWEFAPEIVDAIGEMEDAACDPRTRATVADVLAVAQLVADLKEPKTDLDAELPTNLACQRLGLNTKACLVLVEQSKTELASITDLLAH